MFVHINIILTGFFEKLRNPKGRYLHLLKRESWLHLNCLCLPSPHDIIAIVVFQLDN